MFKSLWEHRGVLQQTRKKSLEKESRAIEAKIEQTLDRIVEAGSPIVIKRFEQRITDLQNNQRVIEEKIGQCGRPLKPYDEMYRTSRRFLEQPHQVWACGQYEVKRAVLKLTLTDRLVYERNKGYRTPKISFPFKALEDFLDQNSQMVRREELI